MLKPNADPASELNRVRGVLHSLVSHPVASEWAKTALAMHDPVALYRYLYSVATACNPFKRTDPLWRKKCMITAYVDMKHEQPGIVLRCKLAATFYLLSEGLYSQPRLPVL